jgi:hypothetical protein
LLNVIHIATLAAVLAPPLLLAQISAVFKIGYGTLNCASGQLQLSCDGTYRGKAFTVLIGMVAQIHIDRSRPVRQLGGINGCETGGQVS